MTAQNARIGGSVAVGGTATLSSMYIATGDGASEGGLPASGPDDLNLIVGGVLNWSSGGINAGSGVYGSAGVIQWLNHPGGSLTQGTSAVDFNALEISAQTASASFAALAANGATNTPGGSIQLIGTDPVLNVFTFPSSIGSVGVSITVPENSAVLINIEGDSATFAGFSLTLNGQTFNYLQNADAWSEVLWNFTGTGTLSISGVQFAGTILAPNANVVLNGGGTSGQVIAGSLNSNFQFGNFPFNGTPYDEGSAIPEPGTVALVGLGIVLLIVGKFRRERVAHFPTT